MTANYLTESDAVLEAGDILAGRTRKLASERHLEALATLVRVASQLLNEQDPAQSFPRVQDWLTEAAKLER